MKFFDSIEIGDSIVTPYSDNLYITANQPYEVVKMDNVNHRYIVRNDNGDLAEYESYLFFEINTYWSCNLYRIVRVLLDIELKIFTP